MKVALIGRVANDENLYDGQTVKTRCMYKILESLNEIDEIVLVDTYEYKKNLISIIFKTLNALNKCDKIVLSVSSNGRKVFFPFMYYANKLFRKDIYHSLIGGRLAIHAKEHPKWIKYLNSFKGNWVECREIVNDLSQIGVTNSLYLPNFKKLKKLDNDSIARYQSNIFSFCIFSRIQKQKGIEDAVEAINSINEEYGSKVVTLDIYGPIDEQYEKEFNCIIDNAKYVRYMGCVNADQSVEAIKNYYALLFPTRYYNEGIPGTIIDALSAGLPIIARRWHYCDEMLKNNVTGYVYDFDHPEELKNCIKKSIMNVEENYKMKKSCILKSKEYSLENGKKMILNYLQK